MRHRFENDASFETGKSEQGLGGSRRPDEGGHPPGTIFQICSSGRGGRLLQAAARRKTETVGVIDDGPTG